MSDKNSSAKKTVKKILNIVLIILIVAGILSTSFGAYIVATAKPAAKSAAPVEDAKEEMTADETTLQKEYDTFNFGEHTNTAGLQDTVKVLSVDDSLKISNAITSISNGGYDTYNNGGTITFYLNGKKEDLLGDLQTGDIFIIADNDKFKSGYSFKVRSVYGYAEKTELTVTQPSLNEVFKAIDIGFNSLLNENNLVSSQTAAGVSMHFGDAEQEISGVGYSGNSADSNSPKVTSLSYSADDEATPAVKNVNATVSNGDFSAGAELSGSDFIVNLDYDLKKDEEEKSKDENKNENSFIDVDTNINFTGKFGIEDFGAYMVCERTEEGKYNELMFGLRGRTVVSAGLEASVDTSIHAPKTKLKYDGFLVDVSFTGLNEKLLPLGIWQFAGQLIPVTKAGFEQLNIAPSIFVMLYMDAEGKISIGINTTLTYSQSFNNGLSIVKDGKFNMNVMSFPYTGGDAGMVDGEKSLKWSFGAKLEVEADLTLLGASVQFYLLGVNIGEIIAAEFGFDGNITEELSASYDFLSQKIETTNTFTNADPDYYLRLYLKLVNLRAAANLEIETIFGDKYEQGFDVDFLLIDLTLWEIGNIPIDPDVVPVSSSVPPNNFETVTVIVADVSGSMDEKIDTGETKLEALKAAGEVIIDDIKALSEIYSGAYGVGVVEFADTAYTIGVPHNDYDYCKACVKYIGNGGGTNIAAGIESATEQLKPLNSKQKQIILMTDGADNHTSDSTILEKAQQAFDAKIVINTIGFGNNADEELLKQIAEKTNGVYRFSSTENVLGITSSFMYANSASNGEVLLDSHNTINEGEVKKVDSFNVPDRTGDLNTEAVWPGSDMDIVLTDPNGVVVTADYTGAKFFKKDTLARVIISDPLPGRWKCSIKGIETSYDDEPFYAISSFIDVNREYANNPELDTKSVIGAYCLPIGSFTTIASVMLLIALNKKRKEDITPD